MIMAIYWTTESCSLAVTSLLPLLLFPILGVLKAKEISTPYFSDTNVLFIGGMMLAVAVEQWNLHKRIALKILLLIGTQPRRYRLHCHITTELSSDTKRNLIQRYPYWSSGQVRVRPVAEVRWGGGGGGWGGQCFTTARPCLAASQAVYHELCT